MKVPQLSEASVRELLVTELLLSPCAILAIRGYYLDTMGELGVNDVGVYDDAMFFVGPGVFRSVRANTDPSKLGYNAAVGKPFAMLQPGTWPFIRGTHKGRSPALRQLDEETADEYGLANHGHFKVWRARSMQEVREGSARTDEGYFAINIHSGGVASTSSWGCLTIPPSAYLNFMEQVWQSMIGQGIKIIYVKLIEGLQ